MSKTTFIKSDGGFTPYRTKIDKSEKKIFEKAMEGRTGMAFEPIAVATQFVAGTIYHFFCNTQVIAPDADIQGARVKIFENLSGEVKIMDIKNFG